LKRHLWIPLAPLVSLLAFFLISGFASALYESLGFLSAPGSAPSLENYRKILSDSRLMRGLAFGLCLSLISSAMSVTIGCALALCFDFSLRLKRWSVAIARLPVALPHIIAAVALTQFLTGSSLLMRAAFQMGIVSGPQVAGLLHVLPGLGVVAAYVWKGLPFSLIVMSARMAHIDAQLTEAARDLGATALQARWHVTLPLLRPALWRTFMILSAFSLCSFEIPFMLAPTTPRTLPVAIFALYGTPGLEARALAMAASMLLVGVSLALFAFYSRSALWKENS
jgi:putative spermidine/putrescine transport system permease protein